LAPRQRAIADLVAEGLTNGQIAGRLGLPRMLVDDEILGAMGRLRLANRLALAAWRLRQPRQESDDAERARPTAGTKPLW
jgi:DNA-binding NarL/FixJ family response regulator